MDLTCDEEMLPESDTPCGSLNLSGAVGGVDDGRLLPLSNEPLFARPDLAILHDPNVLPNMLKAEEINLPSCNYFKNPQSDITPEMRRAVTTWMYEVRYYILVSHFSQSEIYTNIVTFESHFSNFY